MPDCIGLFPGAVRGDKNLRDFCIIVMPVHHPDIGFPGL